MGDDKKGVSSGHPSTTSSAPSAGHNLQGNILREQSNISVWKKYEIVNILGEGSMGAVSKVQVREDQIGGSAYKDPEQNNGTTDVCCGWFFGSGNKNNNGNKKSSGAGTTSSHSARTSERRKDAAYYAAKTIQLDRVSPEFVQELRNEIDILKSMDHPNIVKAHEVYEYKLQIFLVLELCDGGDLYERSPYSEKEAAMIVGKLLSAVKYMHDHDIVHRDLKYENIMFENTHEDAEIKVIDFGLSKKFLEGAKTMTEGVGTIYTMAPQVLQGVYTSQADLWSVGVIAFMLLAAQKPFYHKRRRQVIDRIMRGRYFMDNPIWDQISDDAKNFVGSLIEVDPKKRLTATQAQKHAWMESKFQLSDRKPSEDVLAGVEGCLLKYKNTSALKKIALNVIAHRSSTAEIVQLRKAFDTYDTSNDGVITYEEFKQALKDQKYSEDAIEEIFTSIDVNHNGHIMYTEFLAATLEARGHIEEERLAEAFDRMDHDDSGFISLQNLKDLLGDDCTEKECKAMIAEIDVDKDGQISFDEFLRAFRSKNTGLASSMAHVPSSFNMEESESDLMGLDSRIPGGIHDNLLATASGKADA